MPALGSESLGKTAAALLALLLGAAACSDQRANPEAPGGPAAAVHPQGWSDPAAKANFHGQAIRQQGWEMSDCRGCHGADYAGGIAETSCLSCHPGTPEDCNVCHGSEANIAPPRDTRDHTRTNFAGVGAHQTHVRPGAVGRGFDCTECHSMPSSFADPAHIDGDGRAEVVWGELARTAGREPRFDAETATCAGTYCHSGGRFGNNLSMVWTEVGRGRAACGTCHDLPPSPERGHPPTAGLSCSVCHPNVVDENFKIRDKNLHLNGRTDF